MDNGQIPPVTQPQMPQVQSAPGMPMVMQQAPLVVEPRKNTASLVKTIVIILLSLLSITFIGLFIWMTMQYSTARSEVDSEIAEAVALARAEEEANQKEIYDREKKFPYQTFSGPADYGQLTFLYPKTWSVYVAADAASGGNFNAYFNPRQVDAVGKDTINALRVSIMNKSYEEIVKQYQKDVDKKDSTLSVQSVTIGDEEAGTSVVANRYTGTIPSTDLEGIIVICKIRDKTVIMQTDSLLFQEDFDNLLNTVTFNE